MSNLHIVDIIIIAAYLVGCLIIGFYKSKKIHNIEEYTLGGRRFGTLVIVATLFATFISASATVGIVEKVYQLGLFYAITCVLAPVFWLIMGFIYGKNIDQFRGCLSVSDIMERLYGKIGRWVTNICAIALSIGMVAVQALAVGYIFNYFLGISKLEGIILGVGILTFYSAFGGIRAVALTDVFQFFIFFIAIPTACVFALNDLGGLETLIKKLPKETITININESNVLLFSSWIFYSLIPLAAGAYVQRFLMAKDSKQLTYALKIIASIHLPLIMIICLIGFIVKANVPDIDPNLAFNYFMEHYLYTGVKGLMIAGMLAAIMSTADSWLNTASILCAHDICKKLFPNISAKTELNIARITTFLIGVSVIFIAMIGNDIMGLLWAVGNLWDPFILIPFSVGFLQFKTNAKSFIASIICAFILVYVGMLIDGKFATISFISGIVGSAIGLFGMHYYQVWTGDIVPEQKIVKHYITGSMNQLRLYGFAGFMCKKFTEQNIPIWVLTCFIILFSIIPLFVIHANTVLIILGMMAIGLCFSLHFISYFPKKVQNLEAYLWYGVLLISCPLIASYNIFANHYQIFWWLNALAAMIFLKIFVDWLSYFFLTVIGVIIGYLAYILLGSDEIILTSYMSSIYDNPVCYEEIARYPQ